MPGKKTRKKFTKCFEKLLYKRIEDEDAEKDYENYIVRKIENMDGNDFGMYVILGICTSDFLEQSWLDEFMAGYKKTSNM